MVPYRILILRHAEKSGIPDEDQPEDGPDLSSRGLARAAALAYLLPERFGPVDFLIAAAESRHSNRPIETIEPLARRLQLPINSKHPTADFQGLANALFDHGKYAGTSVLVCWHHGTIPELAAALKVTTPPASWPGEVFDRVWIITYSNGTTTFTNKPQCVLFGDSAG